MPLTSIAVLSHWLDGCRTGRFLHFEQPQTAYVQRLLDVEHREGGQGRHASLYVRRVRVHVHVLLCRLVIHPMNIPFP